MDRYPHNEVDDILVGDCPTGVDSCVRTILSHQKDHYTEYKADWAKYGKAAGPIPK